MTKDTKDVSHSNLDVNAGNKIDTLYTHTKNHICIFDVCCVCDTNTYVRYGGGKLMKVSDYISTILNIAPHIHVHLWSLLCVNHLSLSNISYKRSHLIKLYPAHFFLRFCKCGKLRDELVRVCVCMYLSIKQTKEGWVGEVHLSSRELQQSERAQGALRSIFALK